MYVAASPEILFVFHRYRGESMNVVNKILRERINKVNRKQLMNEDFSLFASNCNGGFILHDLGLKFRSPTVNLWVPPSDFVELLKKLEWYMKEPVIFSDELEAQTGYPVGVLAGRVKVFFQHYKTRDEARKKWIQWSERINYDNIFVLFTDRDGCTYENLKEFDLLPYQNKVVFTHKPYPDIKSAYYIRGFEKLDSVGMCFEYKNKFTGRKYYDQFPYVQWFNGEDITKR